MGSTKRKGPDLAAFAQVIYVGNLPNTANETNLKELFDTFSGGEVRSQPMHVFGTCDVKPSGLMCRTDAAPDAWHQCTAETVGAVLDMCDCQLI